MAFCTFSIIHTNDYVWKDVCVCLCEHLSEWIAGYKCAVWNRNGAVRKGDELHDGIWADGSECLRKHFTASQAKLTADCVNMNISIGR